MTWHAHFPDLACSYESSVSPSQKRQGGLFGSMHFVIISGAADVVSEALRARVISDMDALQRIME